MSEIEDDDTMTAEEFQESSAEWKARGPFKMTPETRTWKDFLGKPRSKTEFVVRDAENVRVGAAADEEQAARWAKELTDNGFIED